MILGIDPKVDYAFKHLFGRDSTRPLLIDILEKILVPAPGRHVETIELLNPFNPREALDDKLSILDIKARDQSGRQFNVEMQMLAFRYYEKRILYYWAKLHQQQLHEGQDYLELKPTISISFLDHVLFPQLAEYHLQFRLLEQSQQTAFSDDLEFHILELPKFTKSATELSSGLDVWLYFLRHAETMDTGALPAALQQPLLLRAVEELTMLAQTDAEREAYEARRKAQLDYNTGLKVARLEGREEGREEGRRRGHAEEKARIIQWCERSLNRSPTNTEQLENMSLEDLTQLADALMEQLTKRE